MPLLLTRIRITNKRPNYMIHDVFEPIHTQHPKMDYSVLQDVYLSQMLLIVGPVQANIVGPDQNLCSTASDLDLNCYSVVEHWEINQISTLLWFVFLFARWNVFPVFYTRLLLLFFIVLVKFTWKLS